METTVKDKKHSTRSGVRYILNEFPAARNDDRVLCMHFWSIIDKITFIDDLQFATTPEAIRRARQWLNEKGFYLSDDEDVIRKRRQTGIIRQEEVVK